MFRSGNFCSTSCAIGYLQRGSWGALAVAGAFIGPALFMVIAAGPAAALGTGGATALLPLGLFFLQAGALVFGSGLAIVPLLRDGVVDQHHRLNQAQFLDAVAMGLTTPGPVVIAAGILGFILHLPH